MIAPATTSATVAQVMRDLSDSDLEKLTAYTTAQVAEHKAELVSVQPIAKLTAAAEAYAEALGVLSCCLTEHERREALVTP